MPAASPAPPGAVILHVPPERYVATPLWELVEHAKGGGRRGERWVGGRFWCWAVWVARMRRRCRLAGAGPAWFTPASGQMALPGPEWARTWGPRRSEAGRGRPQQRPTHQAPDVPPLFPRTATLGSGPDAALFDRVTTAIQATANYDFLAVAK
jgi:hypothetical protein